MDRYQVEDDGLDGGDLPPQDVLADIAAGLDDIRHGRTEPAEIVLAALDAKIKAWETKKAMMDRNGESCADSPAAD